LTSFRLDFPLLALALISIAVPVFGEESAQESPAAPAAQTAPAQIPPPVATAPAKPTGPDYPEPRTFTIGAYYWLTGPGTNPGIITGRAVRDNETLADIGKPKRTPGIQLSMPISRTGELKFDGFLIKGDGNQTIGADEPFVLGSQFYNGDKVVTQYQIEGAKLYIDDLLFPHKFPVSKFRLKSLWEVQYLHFKTTVDLPPVTSGVVATGTKQLILPEIGIAAEYAIAPHVLFRVSGAGFGLYHKADIWDADATLSFRVHSWEVFGGAKALHFKTSPKSAEYYLGTLSGGYFGLRWHF
jgi:hypothetical protein